MGSAPRLLTAGDCALVAEYGATLDERVNIRVRLLDQALADLHHPGVVETVPTYRSLMIHYDPLVVSRRQVEEWIIEADRGLPEAAGAASRVVEIPVTYGGDAGPDLAGVAAHAGLTEQAVVEIHAAGEYLVFMLGFMPGFPYLGGMSPRIAAPRLPTPRTVVPAGSVGIAGAQTGIYPTESPGGWRLIGRTPVTLFDPALSPPALLEAGDYVRFVPVSAEALRAIDREVAAGSYRPVVRVRGGPS
jgi:inhibitor of KinA